MKIDIYSTTGNNDLDPAINVLTLNLEGRVVRVIFPNGAKWDHFVPRLEWIAGYGGWVRGKEKIETHHISNEATND